MLIRDKFETKAEKSICYSIMKLMETQHFEKISVTDIVKQAELGRSTFYLHYENKYDLIEAIEDKAFYGFIKILEKMRRLGPTEFHKYVSGGFYPLFVEYFSYIGKNYYEFKLFFSDNYASGFINRLSRIITKERIKTINTWYKTDISIMNIYPKEKYYREEILSSLYTTTFSIWIKNNMDLKEDKMAEILTNIWRSFVSVL